MKKLLLSFMTILLVIFTILMPMVYADDEETSVEFNFTSSITAYVGDETVTLVISLGDLTGLEDSGVIGFEAVLSYDDSIFDSVTISGLNNWTVTYSSTTGKIVADTTVVTENVDVAELVFTLNDEVETGETTVTLSDVLLTDGTNDFEFTKTCTITIAESSDDTNTESTETTDDTTNSTSTDTTNTSTNSTDTSNTSNESSTTTTNTSDEDNTTASGSLPYTGQIGILIAVLAIVLIATFFGLKWGKYIKDTKKQL